MSSLPPASVLPPPGVDEPPTVGVYVHVPFCERVCPYCDFAVVGGRVSPSDQERYVEALLAELALRAADFEGRRLASVYLGGGTPSLLEPRAVRRIVEAVCTRFDPAAAGGAPEITLEANPGTLECGRLPGFREAGVERLSIGVQSFDDTVLRRLGRAHRVGEVLRTLEAARAAGFANVSLDLLFAAPGQGREELARDLEAVARFAPEHVSCYELVVEPGTPFATAERRGRLARADADLAADMIETIEAALAAQGLLRYELTNYARPGYESLHNRRYWRREPVLGLGMGAWSSDPPSPDAPHGSRRRNPRSLERYLERARAGRALADEVEVLDAATARGEAVFLGLRCVEGLSAERFRRWFDAPPRAFFAAAIEQLVEQALLQESSQGDLRLTPRGRMLSDLVGEQFVSAASLAPGRPRAQV